jgi:hypothetical protein
MPTDGYIWVGSVIGFMEVFEKKLKPRYTVKSNMCGNRVCFIIYDNELDEDVAQYKVRHEFDAKAQAEKLCKQLNEGEP